MKDKEYTAPPVSEEQKRIFAALVEGQSTEPLAIMSGTFQGTPCAFIVEVYAPDTEGEPYTISPLAIIIDKSFLDKHVEDFADPCGDQMRHAGPSGGTSN